MAQPTQTPIAALGEFGLIDRMADVLGTSDHADVVLALGDDAAVYRVGPSGDGGRVHVVTTDALIEGVHFDRAFMPLEYLGYKAMAVNVSDVCAMNALPRFATVALGLPQSMSVEMVEALYRGLKRACDLYGLAIVGGDTTAAHVLTLSITVIGEAAEEQVAYRSGARPGDLLCVSGDVGAAYAGLRVLLDQKQALEREGETFAPDFEGFRYVIGRQLAPTVRINTIRTWHEQGFRPHALIDVSDGIASEVHHLCDRSGVGAVVQAARLPLDLETRAVADQFGEDADTFALFGGEDYELLCAVAPEDFARLDEDVFVQIGRFTDEPGVRVQTAIGETMDLGPGGFQHFPSDK